MARKRPPKYDYICRRCGCPCDPPTAAKQKHIGGGQGMKACKWEPVPVLRSDFDAEIKADVAALRANRVNGLFEARAGDGASE